MSFTNSPNMGLPIPGVGTEPGPNYAIDVNSSLTIVDGHTHLPGSGVYITPGAININAALTFNNNFAINLAGVTLTTQASTPAAQTLYVQLGTEPTPLPDLFYYDGANVVQLTAGGQVNATAANIPGESFAGGTFTWRQGTGSTTPANFDIGSITIRPNVAGTTNGVTLTPPASISSAYNIALPVLPLTTSFLTIDSSGNEFSNISTTGGITGTMIAAGTITGSNIAAATITGSNIASQTITQGLLAPRTVAQVAPAGGVGVSLGSGSFTITGTSVTSGIICSTALTTTGRPVRVSIQPISTLGQISLSGTTNGTYTLEGVINLINSGTSVSKNITFGQISALAGSATTELIVPCTSFDIVDFPPAGIQTYELTVTISSTVSATLSVTNCVIVAYEI